MGLIYNKYPGEWHGPGSISNVMKDLNKIYLPVEDFQMLHFSDGMIYYDKIQKAASQRPRRYLIELLNRQDLLKEKVGKLHAMHTLFKKYSIDDPNMGGPTDQSSYEEAAQDIPDANSFFDEG
mmetsp:Transcript_25372/g.33927  ORF Transcript_25372/g.33927 Transcript_25372/m.33927 type:complete len:123 (+) Transcript_25372:327-695(+)